MKRILSLLVAVMLLCSISVTAFADTGNTTIDLTRTGSVNLWKYDLSSAEMDGVWDSSYVSTGVRDENGVGAILGDPGRVSPLNPNGESYGYAIKNVQFTYLKVASLKAFTVTEDNTQRTELLYGMYYTATESGTIDTIPEIPGLAVWHSGHIGVYIGNGEVIQAMGTRYGVVKTALGESGWTHWMKIAYINYD